MNTKTYRKRNIAPSYEELKILNECYDKTRFLLKDKRYLKQLERKYNLNKYEHLTEKEFLKELKKDLQNVIRSLHDKHMENEFNK
jgi:hypothetical protein|tara:strand:- start:78 stop:332 length:255 start_codon:yes stop_codon:yes gene_type:complete